MYVLVEYPQILHDYHQDDSRPAKHSMGEFSLRDQVSNTVQPLQSTHVIAPINTNNFIDINYSKNKMLSSLQVFGRCYNAYFYLH